MRKFLVLIIIITLCPAYIFGADEINAPVPSAQETVSAPPQSVGLTLQDCYKLALRQSEIIAINAQKIKEAESHFLQAFGTILPQISFGRTQNWRNSDVSPGLNKGFDQVFTFSQSLFTGFKEFAAITGSGLEKNQRVNEKLRAEQLLFGDVSDSFYLLIEIREDLKALEAIEKAFSDRLEELKERENLGKSRTSEVVSTQTQLYSIQDQIEQTRNQEELARQLLSYLTGKPIDQVADEDFDFNLKPESEYLAKVLSRPDVLAANYVWKLGEKAVTIAKSGFFPTVSIEADYYAHRSSSPNDSRVDTQLSIDVPIFEGTTVIGQVKEAREVAIEYELLYQRLKRIVAQEIHDSYVTMQANIARKEILKKAFDSAQLSYNLQLEDYKKSVVNNLDVLTAIQDLQGAYRSYIHITYAAKRFYWQLQVSSGEIDINIK